MKKYLIPLLCLTAFAISACSGDTGGDDPDDDPPYSFNEKSLMGRSRKLAENISKIPTRDELVGDSVSARKTINPRAIFNETNNDSLVDLTNKDLEFYNSTYKDSLMEPTQILSYDILDNNIEYITNYLKPKIMDKVKQLGVWVGDGETEPNQYAGGTNGADQYREQYSHNEMRYRMSYDINSDTVKLEELVKVNDSGTHHNVRVEYTMVYSTYNAEGKVCVKAERMTYHHSYFYDSTFMNTMAMEYIEDEYYRFSCYEPLECTWGSYDDKGALIIEEPTDAYMILLEKDLTDPKGTLAMDYLSVPWGDAEHESYLVHKRFWKDGDYTYQVRSTTTYPEEGSPYNNARNYFIADASGKIICLNEGRGVLLNLYYVTGWNKFLADLQDESGSKLFINNTEVEMDINEVCLGTEFTLLVDETSTTYPVIKAYDDTASGRFGKLDEFLDAKGLVAGTGPLSTKLEYMDDFVDSTIHYDMGYMEDISRDFIESTYEDMKLYVDYSEERLLNMFDETLVNTNEQVIDDTIVEIFDASVNGEAVLDGNRIDLSNVTITLNRNALLKAGDVIVLKMLNKSAFELGQEKVITSVTFNGEETLEFPIPNHIDIINEDILDGESAILFYLVKDNGMRLTDFSFVGASDPFTVTIEDEDYVTVFAVDSHGISIKKSKVIEEVENPGQSEEPGEQKPGDKPKD